MIVKPLFLLALTATLAAAQSQPAEPPVKFAITHVESSKPQIVRIYNLDEGVREIVLPPAPVLMSQLPDPLKTEKARVEAGQPQTIVIFNLGEGTREIELSPVPR
jgi:hypothetical protein